MNMWEQEKYYVSQEVLIVWLPVSLGHSLVKCPAVKKMAYLTVCVSSPSNELVVGLSTSVCLRFQLRNDFDFVMSCVWNPPTPICSALQAHMLHHLTPYSMTAHFGTWPPDLFSRLWYPPLGAEHGEQYNGNLLRSLLWTFFYNKHPKDV